MATPFQDLEARTRIDFPRLVGIDELRKMFKFVSGAVPCQFQYTTTAHESIGDDMPPEPGSVALDENYIGEIAGTVTNRGEGRRSASFRCELNNDYDHPQGPQTRIAKLRFVTTPGYSLQELAGRVSDDLKTMDAVREQIGRYFSAHG